MMVRRRGYIARDVCFGGPSSHAPVAPILACRLHLQTLASQVRFGDAPAPYARCTVCMYPPSRFAGWVRGSATAGPLLLSGLPGWWLVDRAVVIRENGRELARRQDRRAQLLEESHIEQGPASLTWVVGVHDSHWEPASQSCRKASASR